MTIKTTEQDDEGIEEVLTSSSRGSGAVVTIVPENESNNKDVQEETEEPSTQGEDYDVEAPTNETLEDGTHTDAGTRFPFPREFYDPDTKKLMMDPVVAPNGYSYERKSQKELGGGDDDVQYYPNRALQGYIAEELDEFANAGSVRGTLLQWSKSVRSGWQKLLEKSVIPSGQYRPLPDAFYCPISYELIHEPVIDPDGHTYEKGAILHWLQHNTDSPVTRNPLTADQLRDNNNLLRVLEFLTEEENEEVVHPSIRRWKNEHSTRIIRGPEIVPTTTTTTTGTTNNATTNGATRRAANHHHHQRFPSSNGEEMRAQQMDRQMMRTCIVLILGLFVTIIVSIFALPSPYGLFVMAMYPFFAVIVCCYQNIPGQRRRRERIVQSARPPPPTARRLDNGGSRAPDAPPQRAARFR